MLSKRSSGILAHISSLPNRFGIGDLGPSSYDFLSFLREARQRYWQFLPLGPTDGAFDHSPYMSSSAFAGNPLFISPELLVEDGLLPNSTLENSPLFSPYLVQFSEIVAWKKKLLQEAYKEFSGHSGREYRAFLESSADWLHDFAFFQTAKDIFDNKSWNLWPDDIRLRNQKALDNFTCEHHRKIEFVYFVQFLFHRQWNRLRHKANEVGIKLFGDLPIYISYDSADLFSFPDHFLLDPTTLRPSHVAGVPPDYFSATGQRWGNPLYRWHTSHNRIREEILAWWARRLQSLFHRVDTARIDHFRGFSSYWAIAASSPDGVDGKWCQGPGASFFTEMEARLGNMDLVAEDLGLITDEVTRLRNSLEIPGMKVLQFAFDGNPANPYLPCNFESPNAVVYTGTHDNETCVGWYLGGNFDDGKRDLVAALANKKELHSSSFHKDMIYLAMSSTARLSIIPLQDLLGFGNDCRMNTPGTAKGNWRWRCHQKYLTEHLARDLAKLTAQCNRCH